MLFVKDTEEQKHGEEDMCVKNREKGRQLWKGHGANPALNQFYNAKGS